MWSSVDRGAINGAGLEPCWPVWRHRLPRLLFPSSPSQSHRVQYSVVNQRIHVPLLRDRELVRVELLCAPCILFSSRLSIHLHTTYDYLCPSRLVDILSVFCPVLEVLSVTSLAPITSTSAPSIRQARARDQHCTCQTKVFQFQLRTLTSKHRDVDPLPARVSPSPGHELPLLDLGSQ